MSPRDQVADAALAYVARGWAVTPVRGKRPVLRNWQKTRLTKREVRRHFRNRLNVGVLNGEPSGGLTDVDLDAPEALEVAHVFLPETGLVFGRPSKPRSHREYVAQPPPETVQFQDVDGTSLVELRSTGTQTVWPPSCHPSGEAVEFDEDGEPTEIDAKQLRTAVVYVAVTALLTRHWPSETGSRHHIANAVAGFLLRRGVAEDTVIKIVKGAAGAAGDDELSKRIRTARATVRAFERNEKTTGGPTLAKLIGSNVVQRLADWLNGDCADSANCAGEDEPWPPPIPLDSVKVPPFPLDALPPALRDWVQDVAETNKVPPDLPALLALGVVGAAAAGRFEVQVGKTHREPLNDYVAAVAPSGERKAAALRETLFPLHAVQRELQEEAAPVLKIARERRQLAEARLKHVRDAAARAQKRSERQRLEQEAEDLALNLPEVPAEPKLLVNNTTPERLEELLAEQGGTICMASEEAGSVFEIAAGRYSKDGGSQLDTLLLAYDGGEINTERISRLGAKAPRPALSILVTPQPVILQSFSEHPEFQRRGLIGRFAFAMPGSLIGTRLYEDRGASQLARAAYENTICRILKFPRPAEPEKIPAVQLKGAALEVWARHHDRLEVAQADGQPLASIREWASKHASRVARIAGRLHLVTCADEKPTNLPISVATVEAAWRIGWYLVDHALAAHALMGADERVEAARHVLRWVRQQRVESFTKREAFNVLRGHFKKVEDLEPALALLVSYGYLRERETPRPPDRKPQGRKPSPTYDVNPHAHITQNAQNDALANDSADNAESAGQ